MVLPDSTSLHRISDQYASEQVLVLPDDFRLYAHNELCWTVITARWSVDGRPHGSQEVVQVDLGERAVEFAVVRLCQIADRKGVFRLPSAIR